MRKSMMNILKEKHLCLTKNDQGADKGSYKSYIEKFYEIEFAKYREKPIRIMEIGFRHGASLALWAEYFEQAKILGLDNYSDIAVTEDLPIVKEWVDKNNIEIRIGDAYDKSFANEINYEFDIIIDDGPHWLSTQIKAIMLYLNKLKDDGVFVIEDILSGEKSIIPLMLCVPVTHSGSFYQFNNSPDNSLFVIHKNKYFLEFIPNRLKLVLQFVVFANKKIIKKVLG